MRDDHGRREGTDRQQAKGRSRGLALAPGLLVLASALLVASAAGRGEAWRDPRPNAALPSLGASLVALPPGAGKEIADQSCLKCHASDILRQQRLDAKKWAAEVDKMIRWGAEVPDGATDELVAYLTTQFGPDNDRFTPITARPVGQ